jgi:hypothetical protein
MNIKLKIERSKIQDFRIAFTEMMNLQFTRFSFLEYYNLCHVLKKINAINYRSFMNDQKKFTLSLNLNESNDFLNLVSRNSDMFEKSPFYKAMFYAICEDIHKQTGVFMDRSWRYLSNPDHKFITDPGIQ